MEPHFSLTKVMAELEGRSELDYFQRSLAVVVCQALTQNKELRAKFFRYLNWDKTIKMREWLAPLVGGQDLDEWWNRVWRNQAKRFSWVKLGYAPSLNWILEQESLLQKGTVAWSSDVAMVIHPWFRPWITERLLLERQATTQKELADLRKDIQLRRTVSLEWLNKLESSDPSRKDLLMWRRLNQENTHQTMVKGPSEMWFDEVTSKQAHR